MNDTDTSTIRAALDAICQDSLEQPLSVVLSIPKEHRGHVDELFIAMSAEIDAFAARLEESERDRAGEARNELRAAREALQALEPLIDAQFESTEGSVTAFMEQTRKLNEALEIVRTVLTGGDKQEEGDGSTRPH